jgi:hypothetical protein
MFRVEPYVELQVPVGIRYLRMEADTLHRALRLRILHEGLPHESGAVILGHEHGDPHIDANHIGIVPASERIEGIDETVAGPGAAAELRAGE